jgi:hypothetical protein
MVCLLRCGKAAPVGKKMQVHEMHGDAIRSHGLPDCTTQKRDRIGLTRQNPDAVMARRNAQRANFAMLGRCAPYFQLARIRPAPDPAVTGALR